MRKLGLILISLAMTGAAAGQYIPRGGAAGKDFTTPNFYGCVGFGPATAGGPTGTHGTQTAFLTSSGASLLGGTTCGSSSGLNFVAATFNGVALTTANPTTTFLNGAGGYTTPSGGGGSGTVSGQANNVVPLGTSATVIGAQSHLNESTAGTDTFTQPVVVADGVDPGFLGLAPNGIAPAVVAGAAGWGIGATLTTPGYYKFPDAPGSGLWTGNNAAGIVTNTFTPLPLSVANGGTGTTTPALVPGTNVTITGSWPNQTINSTGGGGGGTGSTNQAARFSAANTVSGSTVMNDDLTAFTYTGSNINVPFLYATTVGPTTNTTVNATFTSGATTLVVVSTTGYCVPTALQACYLAIENGGSNPEIFSYTGTTGGNTFTGLTRSLFTTTAAASIPTTTPVFELQALESISTATMPVRIQVWKGNTIFPDTNQVYDINSTPTGTYFEGNVGMNTLNAGVVNVTTTCSSSASPAVCGISKIGAVAVPVGTNPTLVINTSAISTFGSGADVQLTLDQSQGTNLSVTCNTTLPTGPPFIVSRVSGTSLTIEVPGTFATNPVCVNFRIN